MIVRDEELNLQQCLDPLAELFDEIVIVDTGSRDGTKRIARKFTPHVFDFPWCDDFSAARNESLRHATADWIFWLDADDRVRPESVVRLQALLEQLDDRPRAFLVDTAVMPGRENEESYFVSHYRLFRRHPELRWRGRVHEQLQPEFHALGYECLFADVEIDHIGYQDPVLAERKARRKLRLLRMDYAVDPDCPSTLLHLGMALKNLNRLEARSHLVRLVERGLGSADCMRWVYITLASLALSDGQPSETLQFAALGLRLFPNDPDLLFAQACAHYAQENYIAVTTILKTLVRCTPPRRVMFGALANVSTKLAPRMLGAVQRMQRAYADAEATFLTVLQQFPDDISSWYNLGLVFIDSGHAQKTADVCQRLLKIPGGVVDAGLLASLWHLRRGDPNLAGPLLDQIVADSPHSPLPRMLRAEWLSRMQAPIEAQIRALRDVLRVQPGNLEARQLIDKALRFQAAQANSTAGTWSTPLEMAAGVAAG
jgi:tetratricopeptide (TPR) repeat protein